MECTYSKNAKTLSIIIVNWNARELLQNCLNSIKNTIKIKYEVIVVDNNSSDRSVAMIKSEFPDVILLEEKTNLGFSKANNIGFQYSKGDYILILNPDTIVLDGAIDKMINFLEHEKNIGIIGPKIIKENKKIEIYCKRKLPTIGDDFLKLFLIEKAFLFFCDLLENYQIVKNKFNDKFNKTEECECFSGSCMLFRREVFEKLNGFDEQVPMYLDDIDISFRSKKLGLQNIYFADSLIVHYSKGSTKKADNYKMFDVLMWRARLIYYRKNFGIIKESLLKVIIFLSVPFLLTLDAIMFPLYFLNPKQSQQLQLFRKHFNYFKLVFTNPFSYDSLEY